MEQLKGSRKIVLEALRLRLDRLQSTTLMALADETNYHPVTICLTLQWLAAHGYVRRLPTSRGQASRYQVVSCEH